jgi:hypothetical protein
MGQFILCTVPTLAKELDVMGKMHGYIFWLLDKNISPVALLFQPE